MMSLPTVPLNKSSSISCSVILLLVNLFFSIASVADDVCPANMSTSSTQDAQVSDLDGKAPEPTDFANYFCAYAYLYHQVLPAPCLISCASWPALSFPWSDALHAQ
jgi:hypothetical protein